MPWKGTSVENVRYEFVLSVGEDEDTFIDICEAFGISTKTGYKWLGRHREKGKAGLKDQSRAPKNRPRDTPDEIEEAIVGLKRQRPFWGPKKISAWLKREHPDAKWPSITTLGNILKRKGLSTKRRKSTRMAESAPIQECHAPNCGWTADCKGWWKTEDDCICEPLTICDSYSRYLLCSRHVKHRNFRCVWSNLKEAFEEYGMPLRFRTDNGSPFATTSLGRLSHLAVKLVRMGITPEWITPGKPQENGRHERMHRTLKLEAATPPAADIKEQQRRLDAWVYDYSFQRPHEALNMLTPADIYIPSTRLWTGEERDPVYPAEYQQRRVNKIGVFSWKGAKIFTTELLRYQTLGLHELEGGHTKVYFGPILLGAVIPIVGFKRA